MRELVEAKRSTSAVSSSACRGARDHANKTSVLPGAACQEPDQHSTQNFACPAAHGPEPGSAALCHKCLLVAGNLIAWYFKPLIHCL